MDKCPITEVNDEISNLNSDSSHNDFPLSNVIQKTSIQTLIPKSKTVVSTSCNQIPVSVSSTFSNMCNTKASTVTTPTATIITLKELHTVAKQNLISYTQECIAQQLNNCIKKRVLREKQRKGSNLNHTHDEKTGLNGKRARNSCPFKRKILQCPHEGCSRKFTWPAHFKYHKLTHMGRRPYKCTKTSCGKDFYTAQSLEVHMRTHTGERPFACSEEGCGRSFTTAGNLKNHSRIHRGERPFCCTEIGCSKKFVEYSSLRKHLLVHSGEKPFLCDICGKTFSQSGSRNVHRRRHHSLLDGSLEENDSPFVENKEETLYVEADIISTSIKPILQLDDSEGPVILEDTFETNNLLSSTAIVAHSNANVIVLAEPQEIITISSTY